MSKSTTPIGLRIADSLAPLVEQHLAEERAKLKPRAVYVPDPELLAAARRLTDAVDRLGQAQFTSGEKAARIALDRQARAMRGLLHRLGTR